MFSQNTLKTYWKVTISLLLGFLVLPMAVSSGNNNSSVIHKEFSSGSVKVKFAPAVQPVAVVVSANDAVLSVTNTPYGKCFYANTTSNPLQAGTIFNLNQSGNCLQGFISGVATQKVATDVVVKSSPSSATLIVVDQALSRDFLTSTIPKAEYNIPTTPVPYLRVGYKSSPVTLEHQATNFITQLRNYTAVPQFEVLRC
jgi:hypothetical protein